MERNKKFYDTYTVSSYYKNFFIDSQNLYTNSDSFFEFGQIMQILDLLSSPKILLIGVGFGRELDFMLKLSENCKISVIDFNANFINTLGKIYSDDRVYFLNYDLNSGNLPFENESFDYVVCLNTLEYLDHSAYISIIGYFSRVLRSQGFLFTRLYNRNFLFNTIDDYHLKRRPASSAVIFSRNFMEFSSLLAMNFTSVKYFGKGFKINLRFFRWLYTNKFYTINQLFESLLLRCFGLGRARAVYAICSKS